MSTNETRLFCGVFVSVLDLCIAADAYTRLQRPLRSIKLIRRRIENGTIAFNEKGRRINISQFSTSVWEKIIENLVDIRLESAESDIALEAITSIGDVGDSFYEEKQTWWDAVSMLQYDWDQFVNESGGIMGIFKRRIQIVRILLRSFGLVLPTIQNFSTESYENDDQDPQIPVAFPFPSNTSKSSALLFK
ncbi:hypothetical protein JCM5353_008306, partial [Sporobolomyces roseus]